MSNFPIKLRIAYCVLRIRRFGIRNTQYAILLLLLLCLSRPVAAHGAGKMQVTAAPAGPFTLTVWTGPDPARVGTVHIGVAVALAADGRPALEEVVTVRVVPAGDAAYALEKSVTSEESVNKFLYETDFALESAGLYQVVVAVGDTAGDGGEVSFDLLVEEKQPLGWPFYLLVTVALLSVGSVVWYARSGPTNP